MTETKKKVYGYTRVSTSDQLEYGDSLSTQESKIIDYCKRKNLELVSVQKECISGSISPKNRPKLNYIIASLQADLGITGLVVTAIDRLSRSVADFTSLMRDFNGKYDFYCINLEIDSSTPMGAFTMNLFSILSQMEVDLIKSRTREVLAAKKKKGEVTGTVPFGKKLENSNSKLLVDNPEEIAMITLVKELRLNKMQYKKKIRGQEVELEKPWTFTKIAEELVQRGYKNRNGESKFYPSQIQRMLKDDISDVKKP